MLIIQKPDPEISSYCFLFLRGGQRAIVDPGRLLHLSQFSWFLKKSASSWYVVTRKIVHGKAYTIRLHRLIMQCPSWLKVHHINHNTLDNRVCNLQIITEREHRHFDGWHIFRQNPACNTSDKTAIVNPGESRALNFL